MEFDLKNADLHEKIIFAEGSSDLSEHRFDTQLLRAVGASAISVRLGGCAARALQTKKRGDVDSTAEELIREAQRTFPGFEYREYWLLACSAIAFWMDPTCDECSGRKFQVLEGTPMLSDQTCGVCLGSGLEEIAVPEKYGAMFTWMGARLDLAVNEATRAVSRKLGWGVLAH